MRRVSLGRLAIAMACPGSHRDDTEWIKDPPSWSARGGQGFHSAIEVYPNAPDYEAIAKEHNLTARHLEIIRNQHAVASRWLATRYRPSWRVERAYAYDPLTGATRELGREQYGQEHTRPGEWYTRLDVDDPTIAYMHDWKSGRRPMSPPREVPQVWGSAVIFAQHHRLASVTAAVVQVGEQEIDPMEQTLPRAELNDKRDIMRGVQLSLTPDATYFAGEHCTYCPAKKMCSTHAEWKARNAIAAANVAMPAITPPAAPIINLSDALRKSIEIHKQPENMNMGTTPQQPNNVRPIALARMTLKSVVKGSTLQPARILLHAADKVGKSSFAMGAPEPVFIPFDDGLEQLGPARFPVPQSYDELGAALEEVRRGEHAFKTLVLDPINWFEPKVFAKVCEEYGKTNIDEVLGGFQKGQSRAGRYWDQMLAWLDAIRVERKMHIVLITHTAVRNQKNPEAQDWGSWQPAMDKVGAERLKQWADAILFARLEEFAKQVDGKTKGRSTGARVLLTQSNAAYAAGNRYGLPAELPLSWAEFWAAVERGHGKAEELRATARALAKELGPDVVVKCEQYIADAGADANKLAEIINALELKKQSA